MATQTQTATPPTITRQTTTQSLKQTLTGSAAVKTLAQDPFAGNVGHLNEKQAIALDEFRRQILDAGLYKPATESTRASHDEGTLLRFLRARRFDVNGAFQQFSKTEAWRRDNQIDALYDNIDIEDYVQAWSMYPQWTGRRDKRGIPVYVFQVAKLNSKSMSAYTKNAEKTRAPSVTAATKNQTPPRLMRLFALYENLTRFVMPLCSNLPRMDEGTPIVCSNNIVDITGVGLRQFWNLKNHMQDASTLATDNYPETLDRIFVIGAPSFFPTVWGWIKKWFDPVTTSKIFILSNNDMRKVLDTYIDSANIPIKYGGQLNWDFGQLPNIDADTRRVLGENSPLVQNWIPGPMRWVDGENKVIQVGSINGQERRGVIAGLG